MLAKAPLAPGEETPDVLVVAQDDDESPRRARGDSRRGVAEHQGAERHDGGRAAGRAQDVGGADVAAAVGTNVADTPRPRDEKADRHRPDEIRGDDSENAAHDQRSSPGTIAR